MSAPSAATRWLPLLVVAIAAAAGFFWFGLFERPDEDQIPASAFEVRVRLSSFEDERPKLLRLSTEQGFELRLGDEPASAVETRVERVLELRASIDTSNPPTLAVQLPDGRRFPRLQLRASGPSEGLGLGERRYAGTLTIEIAGDYHHETGDTTFLRVTNTVGVEHYLAGVIGPEISPRAAMAALEAQSIAARSYAAHRMARQGLLFDTASSQVYQGLSALDRRVITALRRTKGEILSMDGEKPLATFYHSTCGGHTAKGAEIFPTEADPIPGVASPDCEGTAHYRWSYSLSKEQAGKLVETLGLGTRLVGLQAEKRESASGRWISLLVRGDLTERAVGVREWKIACSNAGVAVPKDMLWHDVSLVDGALAVNGGGFGHGVGMCQMCARRMGERGASAEEILARFYPGARVHELSQESAR
ncbi:MAG: SpoIID/LytB domain-containing protein [Planctomycetes bacterium]|nr:SpoIID/LytB domain-containing protein [Planctomycetota bacterium]